MPSMGRLVIVKFDNMVLAAVFGRPYDGTNVTKINQPSMAAANSAKR